jgi:hypothetical protein
VDRKGILKISMYVSEGGEDREKEDRAQRVEGVPFASSPPLSPSALGAQYAIWLCAPHCIDPPPVITKAGSLVLVR